MELAQAWTEPDFTEQPEIGAVPALAAHAADTAHHNSRVMGSGRARMGISVSSQDEFRV